MDNSNKYVTIITGASSGIGFEIAKLYIGRGCKVYNLSRSDAKLNDIININTDITKENEVHSAFEKIKKECGKIDLLINNAGYGISGAIEFSKEEDSKKQFNVNLFGTLSCTKHAIPLLRKSKGKVIFISSAAAIFAIPFQALYSASKASINIISQALANELKAFDINVCAIQLGDIKTNFTASRHKNLTGDDIYNGVIEKSLKVMEKDEQKGMEPAAIAEKIVKISERKRFKSIYTLGTKYKLFIFLSKILPISLINNIIAKIYIPK